MITILDENEKVIAFGFALPSLAKVVQKSKGRLLPLGLFRILHARNHTKLADFGLVGVRKEFQGKGITAIILDYVIQGAKAMGVTSVETNHSLEDNHKILQTWKNFDDVIQHKRFRCFIKDLNEKNATKSNARKKKSSSIKSTKTSKPSTKKKTQTKPKSQEKNLRKKHLKQ